MSSYTRPRVPGATVVFTVTLADRRSVLFVREIATLREAVRRTRATRPFRIDAWVVLPDHMHCVWTLPEGDADFSGRMGEIKGRFSREVRRSGPAPTPYTRNPQGARAGRVRVEAGPDLHKDEAPIWQKRFWGEARPEIGPVDRFQRRTGGAPAAESTTSATTRTTRPMSPIAGRTR